MEGQDQVWQKVKAAVVNAITANHLPPGGVLPDSNLHELITDSLDAASFLVELEGEFGVHIPDEILQEMRTVGDVVEKIRVLLGSTSTEKAPA